MSNYRRRHQIVQTAVEAAERIIMSETTGSEEETNWLTYEVAKAFFEKVGVQVQAKLLRLDIESEQRDG